MKYIDVHCHVNFPEYDADREEVIRRAASAGVGMIVVGTDVESSENAVKLAERHENVWAIVGLHPTETAGHSDSVSGTVSSPVFDFDSYRKLATYPKVVAIGECGLDYFHGGKTDENRNLQVQSFEDQIRLAHEVGKPLMLHIRNAMSSSTSSHDAYADVIGILKKSKADGVDVTGDVHFFAGDAEIARQFVDLGFFLSFTGVITYADAEAYREVIRTVPLDRLLSETDAPFVSPVPYRGKRNEPAYVALVAKAIAEIRTGSAAPNEDEHESAIFEALVGNAKRLFGI